MHSQVLINKKVQRKIVNIFLPIIFSICLGCSKELVSLTRCICFKCSEEPSHSDSYFEYPQHMFVMRNKNYFSVTHS